MFSFGTVTPLDRVASLVYCTWDFLAAELRGGVMDLQDPVPRRLLPPAVSGHKLPVLKTLHGVVKQPRGKHTGTTWFDHIQTTHWKDTEVEMFLPSWSWEATGAGRLFFKFRSSTNTPGSTNQRLQLISGLMIGRISCVIARRKHWCVECERERNSTEGEVHLLASSWDLVPEGDVRLIDRSPRRGCVMVMRTTTCSR